MSWGNTLNLATRNMLPLKRPDLEIVSVMGGLTKGSDLNSYEITNRLAHLCSAKHSYLTAPLYAGSAESRDTLMHLDVNKEMIDKIIRVDALAMAAGDISSRALLIRDGLPTDVKAKDLIRLGAVGDLLGHVLNAQGQPIDHAINDRVIGIGISDLADIPNVILAAGGKHKAPILRAALNLGIINTLVTDENTARLLLV
jgi:DNA-binding transcriptional regulator LsrR (DeoR family)